MTEAELTDAAWWAWFWGEIEHWSFLAVVVFLAIEFAALKFGAPFKEKIDHAREARLAELTTQAKEADARTKEAELQLLQIRFPRSLNIDYFKNEIDSMARENFEVLYDVNAPDAQNLSINIFAALRQAGWRNGQKLPSPLGPKEGPQDLKDIWPLLPLTQQWGGGPWGLSVVTNASPDINQKTPAARLVLALGKSIVGPPSQTTLGRDVTMPNGLIRIIVGPKLP